MRLLDRYLLRELLVPLTYCLGGFFVFWVAFDLFSNLSDFQDNKLRGRDVAEYYFVRSPELLTVVLPVALLLALLYALTNHARHNELTAMRAAGVSLWRLSAPYLLVGFGASLFLLVLNEVLLPDSADRADRILRSRSAMAAFSRDWQTEFLFRNDAADRHWSAAGYHLPSQTMTNVHVRWKLPDGSWHDIWAENVRWTNQAWRFEKVRDWMYDTSDDIFPEQTNYAVGRFPFSETPELLRSELKVKNLQQRDAAKRPQLSIREIHNYLQLHPQVSPREDAILQTQLHARLAMPWTCLVVVLIAIPFGAPGGRRNVFVGVAASIFICFAYFVISRIGLALGVKGSLPGWMAAWLPNLVFALVGSVLTSRVR